MLTEQKGTWRWPTTRLITLLIAAIGLVLTSAVTADPASAASYCQCVTYVQRYEHLRGTMANGTDMGRVLRKNGFRHLRRGLVPRVGDVAVWRSTFQSPYGHVAVVHSVRWNRRGLAVGYRGANQGGRFFTQADCHDVSVVTLDSRRAIYYRRR